jgi:hypothetical protein
MTFDPLDFDTDFDTAEDLLRDVQDEKVVSAELAIRITTYLAWIDQINAEYGSTMEVPIDPATGEPVPPPPSPAVPMRGKAGPIRKLYPVHYDNLRNDIRQLKKVLEAILQSIEGTKDRSPWIPAPLRPFIWFSVPFLVGLYFGLPLEKAMFFGVVPAVAAGASATALFLFGGRFHARLNTSISELSATASRFADERDQP